MEIEIENQELDKIDEKSLSLQIRKKTIGELETNASQVRDIVKKVLVQYETKKYTEEDLQEAKRDRATLNKAEKGIKDDLKKIKSEWMTPLSNLESIISDISNNIKKANSSIDLFVKSCEAKEKEDKKAKIQDYFNREIKNNTILKFENVFKEEWLNKTFAEKNIINAIDDAIYKSNKEIELIDSHPEKGELMEIYLVKKDYASSVIELNARNKRKEEAIKAFENKTVCTDDPSLIKPIEQPEIDVPSFIVPEEVKPKITKFQHRRIFHVTAGKDEMNMIKAFIEKHSTEYRIEKYDAE